MAGLKCMRQNKSEILVDPVKADDPDRQLFICSLVVCSVTITNANSKRQPNADALVCREALTHQNCNFQ